MIGPRLATLIYATTPIMTTTIAWFMIDEQLAWVDLFGIAVTISGVSWVVAERRYKNLPKAGVALDHPDSGSLAKGILYGLGAALGQAAGLVLAKHAMFDFGGEVDPMSASMVRMVAAMLIIWSISLFRGTVPSTIRAVSNKRAMLMCAGGAIAGPFFGVWMSLLALRYIEAGIAATFNHTTPIMVIPLLWFVYRERTSLRGFLGAALAVGGVALLVLS
jgi:drug/metabolite transporter (DMT)-like permease